jgi:hypothetical protein
MAKAQLNNGYATTVYFDKETSEAAKTLAGNLKISMSAYLRLLV